MVGASPIGRANRVLSPNWHPAKRRSRWRIANPVAIPAANSPFPARVRTSAEKDGNGEMFVGRTGTDGLAFSRPPRKQQYDPGLSAGRRGAGGERVYVARSLRDLVH
ncbi:hypothetical protein Aduo_017005 [Ancylostoma duodenale]